MTMSPLWWGLAASLASHPNPEEVRKAEQARPLTVAAGVTASASVALALAVSTGMVSRERCRVEQAANADPFDESGGGLFDDCSSLGMFVWPIPALALSTSTTVLAAFAGDRWGWVDGISGRGLPPSSRLAYTLGGIGMRIAGAALIIGGVSLGSGIGGCPTREEDRHMSCFSAMTHGTTVLITGGATARWVGTGMLAYGVRHYQLGRRTLTLRPSLMGISGSF